MSERIAIIDGLRSPIGKAGGALSSIQADTLSAIVTREVVMRSGVDFKDFDEVVIGNVAQPSHASNVARVIAMRAGFDKNIPAMTVNRNCASGMEAITTAANKIYAKDGEIFLAGGVESMSNIPFLYSDKMKNFLTKLSTTRNFKEKISLVSHFEIGFLKPVIGLVSGLTDPISGVIMGVTAENLAKKFHISREEQDKYAVESNLKAQKARDKGIFAQEILPIVSDIRSGTVIEHDDGIRDNQSIEALAKLKPFFDRKNGTVTAGNSSQISDGAASVVLMSESKAKERGLKPLGYLRSFTYVGLEASEMGLGPIFATKKLLDKNNMILKDIDLFEINEAFAAQVIANEIAFASKKFFDENFGGDTPLGEIDRSIINKNGGAIALGHPVGMSGARIVIHTLKELHRRKKHTGIATLCIGGGQGAALLLEAE